MIKSNTRDILIPILKELGFRRVIVPSDQMNSKEMVEFFDGMKWENYWK